MYMKLHATATNFQAHLRFIICVKVAYLCGMVVNVTNDKYSSAYSVIISFVKKILRTGRVCICTFYGLLLQSQKRLLISNNILSTTAKMFLSYDSNELGSSTSTGASTMISANLEHNFRFLRVILSGMFRDSQIRSASVQHSMTQWLC
jgi:hypothetical protein